ncbi:MAG: WD40 repeat protein/energy-coupling factor transporter ATP-binding protein EcfA2 [Verrucomicrobiales bacterium]|jgi:WD40 repeat protein/energy-coupling factor transporter ATP-binding protein EcfA2
MSRRRFNPFPGLRPFRMDETHLFFGREEQTEELLQRLRDHRFLAVVGTSGSGKSSLVRAGLLPELYGGTMLDAGFQWEVAMMRPGGNPLTQLAEALVDADLYDRDRDATVHETRATLSRSGLGLVEAVRQSDIDTGSNLLVVVDQFEELLRFRGSSATNLEEASDFVELLLRAAQQSDLPIYIVLTMRSDYLGDCSEFPGLAEAVNGGEYLIPRLSRQQRRRAIEGPVRVGGGAMAPRLLQTLLNDVGDNPDHLPVLQHALMRTWEEWEQDQSEDEPIDLRHYQAVGGMAAALSRHADEVFNELPDDHYRTVAGNVFKALTERSLDNRGIRRPASLGKLCAVTDADAKKVITIIEEFRKPGRTFLMPGEQVTLTPETVIDISHESLMRVWRRLDGWVEEESQSARIYRRLRETAELHADGRAGLYHNPDLQIAQSWQEERVPNQAWAAQYGGRFEPTLMFLDQSAEGANKTEREKEAARQHQLDQAKELAESQRSAARSFKRFGFGMGVVAILALAALGFANTKTKEAEKAKDEAYTLRIEAENDKKQTALEVAGYDFRSGQPLIEQGHYPEAVAYLARSLERNSDNPAAIDQIFNLLAYYAPPGYRATDPHPNFGLDMMFSCAATDDSSMVATCFKGNLGNPGVFVWSLSPLTALPIYQNPGVGYHWSHDFSPDGSLFLSGHTGASGHGSILNTHDWSLFRDLPTFSNHDSSAITVGRFFASGTRYITTTFLDPDPSSRIWDTQSGDPVDQIKSEISDIPLWSPNERQAAISTANGYKSNSVSGFKLHDLTTDTSVQLGHGAKLTCLAYSPDGTRLLAQSGDGTTSVVWNLDTGKHEFALQDHGDSELDLAEMKDRFLRSGDRDAYVIGTFTPDGQHILTAATDQTVRLWDASNGRLLKKQDLKLVIHPGYQPQFSADGRRVMLVGRKGMCQYAKFEPGWMSLPEFSPPRPVTEGFAFLANEGNIKPLLLPLGGVVSSFLHPVEPLVVLGSDDGRAAIYDLRSGEHSSTFLEHNGVEIQAVAMSEDAFRVATGSQVGTIRIWNVADAKSIGITIELRHEVDGAGASAVRQLRFFADGNRLFALSETGFSIWDVSTGDRVFGKDIPLMEPWGKLSPDGARLVGFSGHNAYLFSLSPGIAPIKISDGDEEIRSVAFDHEGTTVAINSVEGTTRVWSTASDGPITTPGLSENGSEEVLSMDLTSDGNTLAAGCKSGNIQVCVPADHQVRKFSNSGGGACTSVQFSNDGRLLAAVFALGSDSYARVWNVETGVPITAPLAPGGAISDVAFINQGRQIVLSPRGATADGGGFASVWDVSISDRLPSPEWLPEATRIFGGMRLDKASNTVAVDDDARTTGIETIAQLKGQSPAEQFYHWLGEFPGTRSDSPFRPKPSDAYVEGLIGQGEFELVDEAVRLRPRNARALARRAALRLSGEAAADPGNQILSRADLIRARLLAPDDIEVAWCRAMTFDKLGDPRAERAYKEAKSPGALSETQLDSVLLIEAALELKLEERRSLLNRGIEAAEAKGPAGHGTALRMRVKRFLLAAQNGNFPRVQEDWNVLKEQTSVETRSLTATHLKAVHAESQRLYQDGEISAAIALLKPAVLIASLDAEDGMAGAWFEQLIEWEYPESKPITLIPKSAVWSYLDDGSEPGAAWRAQKFDDTSWKKEPAILGYGEIDNITIGQDVPSTEIDYGPDKSDKHITSYFRRKFDVSEIPKDAAIFVDVLRDDGVVIYLNGVEIVRDNLPPGELTAETEGLHSFDVETRYYRFRIDPSALLPGENFIAAAVHQIHRLSSDLGFALQLTAVGNERLPSEYLPKILAGEEGAALMKTASDWIPKKFRKTWVRDFKFVFHGETGDPVEEVSENRWIQGFDALEKLRDWRGAAARAESRLKTLRGSPGLENVMRIREWLMRKEAVFLAHGQREEADLVSNELSIVPERAAARNSKMIDLSRYYTVSLYDPKTHAGTHSLYPAVLGLDWLPGTFEPENGIEFDLRGAIYLNSGELQETSYSPSWDLSTHLRADPDLPAEVIGIPVTPPHPARAIHFLHASIETREAPGTVVAHYVVHYQNGDHKEIEVKLGTDIADVNSEEPSQNVVWSRLATKAIKQTGNMERSKFVNYVRVQSWTNPHPEKTISSIDLVSEMKQAGVIVLGITLE